MSLQFEWDPEKARRNVVKHGVTFEEAALVFSDPHSITIPDSLHSRVEQRFVTLGECKRGRLLVVAHTDRRNRIRIISARKATKHERKAYEEG